MNDDSFFAKGGPLPFRIIRSSTKTSNTAKSMPLSSNASKMSNEDFILDFFQKRNYIIKKISQINQRTTDQAKRRDELRKLVFSKPLMKEAREVEELIRNSSGSFSQQGLQELQNEIELSSKCLEGFEGFYIAQQKISSQDEKIRQTNLMIEVTWEHIYKLTIHDPALTMEVFRLEWITHAIDVLSYDRDDLEYPYLQNCKTLKKEALASQDEKIMESKFYKKIEEDLQKQKDLIEKVKLLFKQERNKTIKKMEIQEVKKLLQELKEFGMKQEVNSVEGILKKAENIVAKFNEFLRKKALVSGNDLHEFMLEILNSPIRFERIQEHLTKLLKDQKEQTKIILQETAQRITEENRELYGKFQRYAEEISMNYESEIPAEELWKLSGEEVQKITKYSAKIIEKLHAFQFEDFCFFTQQSTTRGYEHIRAELWLAKIKFFQILCQSIVKPFKPITFVEFRGFLSEIRDYIDSLPEEKRAPFDEQLSFLTRFLHEIRVWVKEEQEKKVKIEDKTFYGFIDVTRLMTKPVEKKPKILSLKALVKKLKAQDLENLNQKRNSIDDNENQHEKIVKKIKIHTGIYQPPKSEILEINQEKMKEFFNDDCLFDEYFAFGNSNLGKSNSLVNLFDDGLKLNKSNQKNISEFMWRD